MKDNGAKPATREDLVKLRGELLGAMGKQREELLEALGQQREELLEAVHDGETRLLRAFYAYGEAAQKHFGDLDRSDFSIRERLEALETRVFQVEKRLDLPSGS